MRARVLCLGVLLAAAVVSGCEQDRDGEHLGISQGTEPLPDQEISDFKLRETEDERLVWVLEARTALVYEDRQEIRTREPIIYFFDAARDTTSVLTARDGEIDQRTNEMVARGEVVLRSLADGRILETEVLHYSPRRGKVFTDEFVRIIDGDDVLTGYGLESDPNLERGSFEIKRDVRSTVHESPVDTGGE